MRTITVDTINGPVKETVYDPSEWDYRKYVYSPTKVKHNIRYYEIPCAFDIETTTISEDQEYHLTDSAVYQHLKGLRLFYDDRLKHDIPDFNDLRKKYFNQVHLRKGSPNIDRIYIELNELFPYYFSADIINPADQLLRILDVYDQNKPKTEEFRPFAFMYHWQFCMGEDVFFGRTWEELTNFFDWISYHLQLNHNFRLPVYVHNLSYEFQFMRRFFIVTDGFYRDIRKPLKALLNDSIELRDSYALSNMSLEKFCKNTPNVTHYKLVDTYDYSKLRTPETPLTEEEEAYCYNDVRGLAECIREYMQHDSLSTIPMTSTGFVRREYRKSYAKNKKLRQYFKETALDAHLYDLNRAAFRGGDTHANLLWGRQTVRGVHSYDIKSSYPACMMMDRYPMGKFFKVAPRTFYNRDMSEYAMLIKCRFVDLIYTGACGNPYLSLSRCEAVSKERVIDNGRIMRAAVVQCVLTDIDLEIMKAEYSFSDFYIAEVWASHYGPLPDEFKATLMDYFRKKTQLDGDPESFYEYTKAKNRLNSSYGMMVTDIAKPKVIYVHGEYKTEPIDIDDALEHYYKSRNSFLSYQHGVWVTANARLRLRRGLWLVGRDNVYDDTDSIKCRGDHRADFDRLNEENKRIALECGAYAEAPDGSVKILGSWEEETPPEGYEEFRTLGAKKYIVRTGGHYYSTIAGVSKKAGEKFFNEHGIESFEIGTVIERSGHLVAYYNDDQIHRITVNGCTFTTAANTALINDCYTIGITGEYLGLLENALAKRADIV